MNVNLQVITVKERLFEEILLPSTTRPVRIEVAAEGIIDCGILDDKNYRKFAVADDDSKIEKTEWFSEVKAKAFEFTPKRGQFYWLILWNAYLDKEVSVAYSLRPADG